MPYREGVGKHHGIREDKVQEVKGRIRCRKDILVRGRDTSRFIKGGYRSRGEATRIRLGCVGVERRSAHQKQ